MSRLKLPVLAGLVCVVGSASLVVATAGRVLATMHVERGYEVRYLPDPASLRFLAPGPRLSIANAYWLAAVQYIGDQYLSHGSYDRLYPLIDLVTDLDPQHGYAFQTAGIVLSSAGRLDESDRILRKGIERGPNWWSYPFYIAFNNFFYRGDYAAAARWAAQAARTPGASTNISQLALSLKVKSGDPESGVALLEQLRAQVHDERTATALDEQIRLALLQRDFARLDEAVRRYKERTGRAPASLEQLSAAGFLSAIPPEPFGGRYELRADGKVHSTARDFRFSPAEKSRGSYALPSPPPMLLRRSAQP